jgi:predicted RNA-binding protein with PIN domain
VAREELVNHLTQYFDTSGTPLTTIFDGTHLDFPEDDVIPEVDGDEDVTLIYTQPGQTPVQMMHRLIRQFRARGGVLVVTDGNLDRGDLEPYGGQLCRCSDFITMVKTAHEDMEREIERLNQMENRKFTCQG